MYLNGTRAPKANAERQVKAATNPIVGSWNWLDAQSAHWRQSHVGIPSGPRRHSQIPVH